MAGEWGDVLQALGLSTPDTGEPTVPPSALQAQVAGFPARGANMLMGALGPLGEAGMTLGEMLRTRQFDSRLLPQIAGGIMLGTAAPGGLEANAAERGFSSLGAEAAHLLGPQEWPAGFFWAQGRFGKAAMTPAQFANKVKDWPATSLGNILGYGSSAPYYSGSNMVLPTQQAELIKGLLGPNTVAKAKQAAEDYAAQSAQQPSSSLSEAAIGKALAANPGASIFDLAGHSEMAPKYKMPEPPEPEDYSDSLVPIEDWSALRGPHGSAEFEDVATRERARGSGFNVDLPLYKGGGFQNYPVSLSDPARKSWEKGTFFSPEPEIAGTYTHSGGIPLEYVARAQQPVEIDWPSATGLPDYSSSHMGDIISSARKQGADMLVIRNMHDQGGKQDQYVVLDPSIVRQPGAQFDPAKLHWNELAAGLAGAGAIPALAHEEGQQE